MAHEERVLTTKANNNGSGELAHPCSLARAFTVCSHNIGNEKNLQLKIHISDPADRVAWHCPTCLKTANCTALLFFSRESSRRLFLRSYCIKVRL